MNQVERQERRDQLWEIDIFKGKLEGLIIAEIELKSEDEEIGSPSWCGKEITDDHRYSNASLAMNGLPE